MEKTRRVGVLTKRVIELLELELPEGKDILLGDSNIGHMTTRHPEDFALYGEYIPDILREPDYVAQNKKDNSIEYVRNRPCVCQSCGTGVYKRTTFCKVGLQIKSKSCPQLYRQGKFEKILTRYRVLTF